MFYTGSTWEAYFKLPEDASNYPVIEVSFKQGGTSLVKTRTRTEVPSGMTVDGKDIDVTLTQQEANLFTQGSVTIQIRALTTDGLVLPSKKWNQKIERSNSEAILE